MGLFYTDISLWECNNYNNCITTTPYIPAAIDCGSETNIINISAIHLKQNIDRSRKTRVRGIDGNISETVGIIRCTIEFLHHFPKHNDKRDYLTSFHINADFHVSDNLPTECLIGLPILRYAQINLWDGRMEIWRYRNTMNPQLICIPLWTQPCNTMYNLLAENEDLQTWDNKMNDLMTKQTLNEKQPMDYRKIPINGKIPKTWKDKFKNMLEKYNDLFTVTTDEYTLFKNGNHEPLRFPLSSSVYTKAHQYGIPSALLPDFEKQMKTWLKAGVIARQHKNVKYRNNIVSRKKQDGSIRFCLDASALNTIIRAENQIIPKINQILHDVSGHHFYTQLDLSQFFLSFQLDEESSDLTTFFSPIDGLAYRFLRSPFGIRWSMSYAVRLSNTELAKIPNVHKFLRIYVDDVIIYSMTLDEHYKHLDSVLKVLKECRFKIKPAKMKVCFNSTEMFGHYVDSEGFTISKSRKEMLLKLKRPTSRKELLTVIGQLSYYRGVMSKELPMGKIQAEFADLVSEKKQFRWLEKHDATWDMVKQSLFNMVKLTKLLPTDKTVILRSDSSETYFGATLHALRNNQEHLIHCTSRKWIGRFLTYHITRKELLAVCIAIKDLKFDLIGRKVLIELDNSHAAYVLKHPDKAYVSQRCAMHSIIQNLYEIDYEVIKTTNKNPKFKLCDLLSRQDKPKVLIPTISVKELITILPLEDPDNIHTSYVATRAQLNNTLEKNKRVFVPSLSNSVGISNMTALYKLQKILPKINHHMNQNDLKHVPEKVRLPLVHLIHSICHFGRTRIIAILLAHNYRWPKMTKDVGDFIRNCKTCQTQKPTNKKLQISTFHSKTKNAGEDLAVDIKVIKGNNPLNILVMVDYATHFMEAIRIPGRMTSDNVAKQLTVLLSRMAPTAKTIRFDNDPIFKAHIFKDFIKALNILPIYGARLNSRSSSLVERTIGYLTKELSLLGLKDKPHSTWDLAIAISTLFINLNPRISMGSLSPYELVYGRSIILDGDKLNSEKESSLQQLTAKLRERIHALQTLKRIIPRPGYPKGNISLHDKDDLVRIKIPKPPFESSTTAPKWSSDIFKIIDTNYFNLTYKLQNTRNPKDIRIAHDRGVKLITDHVQEDYLQTIDDILKSKDDEMANVIENEMKTDKMSKNQTTIENLIAEKNKQKTKSYNLRSTRTK